MKSFFQALIVIYLISYQVDAAPAISDFDKVGSVAENTGVNVQLSTIKCADADGDTVRVKVQVVVPNAPCTNCFEVIDCAPDFCLQYRAGVGSLSYSAAQSYLVQVVCEDNVEAPAYETIEVLVYPNTPPYFATYYVDDPITVGSTGANVVLYDADATDDDGDTLTYSMQVVPSSAAFGFTIDSVTGEISSAVDMRAVCTPHVTFLVTASDGMDSSRNLVVNSVMTGANVAPVGVNLNREVQVPEDETGVFFRTKFVDDDTLTYTYTSPNALGLAQYNFNGRPPRISVDTGLDYEDATLRQTYVTIQATDGYCTSPDYFLKITVTDVNEPPVLAPLTSSVTVCEGEREHWPGLTVTDPDTVDTQTWGFAATFNNFRGRFAINRDTGFIRTTMDYDVDQNNMFYRIRHHITVKDKGGLEATATVTVTYLDCNDNAPRFDGVTLEHRRTYYATECTAGGSRVGRVIATDIDSAREGNNVITYSGGAGCCRVDTAGRVIVDSALPAGNVITFNAYATDEGQTPGPLTSVEPAVVTVVFTVCPPPATTTVAPTTTTAATTPKVDHTESYDNVPWIIIAAILATLFLALLAYMLWRYCRARKLACNCRRRVKPRPKEPHKPADKPVREEPKTENPPPANPGYLFGFWKTRYPNDDAKAVPDLKAKPEPGDIEKKDENTYDPVEPPKPPTPPPPPPKKKSCNIL